jgi:hypothetical protein
LSGFGYSVLGFGSTATHGPAALAATIVDTNSGTSLTELVLNGDRSASAGTAVASGAGELDFTVTATGGDGSYSYAWTLIEVDDLANTFTLPTISVTTNAVGFVPDGGISGTVLANGNPPADGVFAARCVVSDGASAEVTIEHGIAATLVGS